ncbi:hypothetical protein ACFC58_32725 [Kitasatospora purpeofusca]|uniref:HD domain-containing protein n=1 Tax=Kitasatospora purpeofusca TaxID=67352 RepID=UPI0035E1F917
MEAKRGRPDLWQRALGDDAHPEHRDVRRRFAGALGDMRIRAAQLATEIARDLPEYTQHDVSHLDALWELADLIAGPDVDLNPAEAFVLGAAMLTHDLAMSRAAHSLVDEGLRARPEWPDALAAEIRRAHGRAPYTSELASPPPEPARAAEKRLLRDLHADMAERLPLTSWPMLDHSSAHLLNDPELRSAYGRLIGRIAASHHWDYDRVVAELSASAGCPSFAPVDWKVDSLFLACLLRTADAAHLDASRTPDLLAAVRRFPAPSKEHWVFQSRLQRPYLEDGRLVFTASAGFHRDEMGAWWLAYDALRVVDAELRSAESVLTDTKRRVLRARAVAHIDSPASFRTVAPCHEWEPVQAQIKVSDVAGLVQRLGGAELYGDDWSIGLREVLVNAHDAVRAREALARYRGRNSFTGRITVTLVPEPDGLWLVCGDNGIGMSAAVLGRQLLDFGCSSWLSPEVTRENPGIIASSFEPTGRFGIGFFSAFLAGDRVQVVSRPLSGAPADTWILEFDHGVEVRPALRRAHFDEQLDEPGTTVRIRLHQDIHHPADPTRLCITRKDRSFTFTGHAELADIVPYLLPAPEVDVWIGPDRAMERNDWLTVPGAELMERITGRFTHDESALWMGKVLQPVQDATGRTVARIGLIDYNGLDEVYLNQFYSYSTVTAGPARTDISAIGLCGVLIGTASRAARDAAIPVIDADVLATWATAESSALQAATATGSKNSAMVAETVLTLGGDPEQVPLWLTRDGRLTSEQFVHWLERREEVRVAHPVDARVRIGMTDLPVDLADDTVYFEWGRRPALAGESGRTIDWPTGSTGFYDGGVPGEFVNCVRRAWNVELTHDQIARITRQKTTRRVGEHDGRTMEAEVEVFCRPSLSTR